MARPANQFTKADAFGKVTGSLKYTFDIYPSGMLTAKVLRSKVPHAKITRIDVSDAMRLRGVRAILTHENFPQLLFNPIFNAPDPDGPHAFKEDLIFDPIVRYVGAPVAAVAAESEEIAEEALAKIEVDYEEMPAVFDPADAIKTGAPLVRKDRPGNLAIGWTKQGSPITLKLGDQDKMSSNCDLVYEGNYRTQRMHQAPLENLVTICEPDWSGRINVWSSTQSIHGLRSRMSECLGISPNKIRVVKTMLGGGFGAKLDMKDIDPICAILALRTAKPVRIETTREEFFAMTPRHPSDVYLKTGVSKDGKLVYRYCKGIFDIGATADHGPSVTLVGGTAFLGAYKAQASLFEGYAVYTNNPPSGGMRGYGGPQLSFGVETQMDEIAEELSLDPIQFRLRNAYEVGDISPISGFRIETCGLKECAELGSSKIDWKVRNPKNKATPHKERFRRGIGVSFSNIFYSGCHGSPEMPEQILEYSGAIVKVNQDGTVDLVTAVVDQGAGQSQVLAQVVAEELGIDVENVVVSPTDTDNSPFDVATHAGRVTYVAGYATKVAAREAKDELLRVAAEMFETRVDDLELTSGHVRVRGTTISKSVGEIAWYAHYDKQLTIIGKSSTQPPGNPSPFGVIFAEVEVDTLTGKVSVLRAVDVHDIGRVINRLCAEGQVEGAIAQGVGYALYEEILMEQGQVVNPNFGDYKLPTAKEVPESEVTFLDIIDPGATGAKSVSESSLIHVAPAIGNAIYDALGIRLYTTPFTPQSILAAIEQSRL